MFENEAPSFTLTKELDHPIHLEESIAWAEKVYRHIKQSTSDEAGDKALINALAHLRRRHGHAPPLNLYIWGIRDPRGVNVFWAQATLIFFLKYREDKDLEQYLIELKAFLDDLEIVCQEHPNEKNLEPALGIARELFNHTDSQNRLLPLDLSLHREQFPDFFPDTARNITRGTKLVGNSAKNNNAETDKDPNGTQEFRIKPVHDILDFLVVPPDVGEAPEEIEEGQLLSKEIGRKILVAYFDALKVPESERKSLVEKFEIEIARTTRPKWVGRLERGGELATLSAPLFLKCVHADYIGEDGTVENEIIRAIDPDLMKAVEAYISARRTRANEKGIPFTLGDAEGLEFVLTRPGASSLVQGRNRPSA